ncbi:LytR C-terminal domain-containing protein [Boudabousia marimammalium]|uniref:LytR/CpsA/Psr regulator C-terminal domain-containing protein n=1 Tax=Boudabousia marimammalium TaxID=156892 RepID=A0A1Q5PM68_9ACTO|nr:LytR C-terminal domain-containing protein [Boudabousia marimammalium]OKL48648.1 hypothetical protein BM477_05450 [Boudabousia marimammalium]
MSTANQNPREQYREALARRRATTFLVLFIALLVILLSGILFATNTIKAPFNPAFKHGPITPTYFTTPCLPDTTNPVELDKLTVNVYNTTEQSGLAGTVAKQLKERKITVATVSNSSVTVTGAAEIRTSVHSLQEAYTLAEMIPNSVVVLVRTDPKHPRQLSLLLGDDYDQIVEKEAYEGYDPDRFLNSPAECVPVDSIFVKNELQNLLSGADTNEGTPSSPEGTPPTPEQAG